MSAFADVSLAGGSLVETILNTALYFRIAASGPIVEFGQVHDGGPVGILRFGYQYVLVETSQIFRSSTLVTLLGVAKRRTT